MNGISGVGSAEQVYDSTKLYAARQDGNDAAAKTVNEIDGEAGVYEKSEEQLETKMSKIADPAMLARLKAEADAKTENMRSLIEKLILKQGQTILDSDSVADMWRKYEVTPEVQEQAQKDIADDGYWGVEQTSDRILSFAKALAGDDAELAAKMVEATKEGFKQAGEDWGEEMPDLSQRTMNTTLEKMDKWLSELKGSETAAGSDVPKTV